MSANCGESLSGEKTIRPSCCGKGSGIPRLVAFCGVSSKGGGRLTFTVRESLTPRANKKVAEAVRFRVSSLSAPTLAIALREVCRCGSEVKIDGRIKGIEAVALPP